MGILRNLGLASLMVVGTLLPQGNLPASPSDASEKLLKINYRAASGNTEDFYTFTLVWNVMKVSRCTA